LWPPLCVLPHCSLLLIIQISLLMPHLSLLLTPPLLNPVLFPSSPPGLFTGAKTLLSNSNFHLPWLAFTLGEMMSGALRNGCRNFGGNPDLCCRKLMNGQVHFLFSAVKSACVAHSSSFRGASLSLIPWSQEIEAFKTQKVCLRAFKIPLHVCMPKTLKHCRTGWFPRLHSLEIP
ncbi:hypothetical protein AMTR_s00142p00059570, partial [Amborella trichopoda]